MINLGEGNLLEADVEAIVNTVNCVGVMGKGIALQFKQAFPDNFKAYEQACRAGQVRLGEMFVFDTRSMVNPRWIINFPTKKHWKARSRLSDIRSGLKSLRRVIREHNIQSIAIPPLGCGNGGLSWADVEPVIRVAFDDMPDLSVLLYAPSGAPQADSMRVGTARPNMTRGRALILKLLGLYGEVGYRHSLLEVQKLSYLLQEAGEPLRLNFVKYHYGPYADNLNHVLQRIEGHFIRGYGDRSRDAEIYLLPGAAKEADEFLEGDEHAKERLARVASAIEGFETPYGMELLSTLHWVAREDAQAAEDPDRAIAALRQWNPRKGRAFRESHVITAWKHLNAQRWLVKARPPTDQPETV